MSIQPLDSGSAQFALRATDLLSNHPWMDHQSATVLAQQPTSDAQMHAQAVAMGQQLAQSWDGYEQAFYDPVLQAQPSQAQASVDYVNQVVGAPPVTSNGVVSLQQALQRDGFLQNAPNGVWDKATEDAYNRAYNALKNEQYAGAPKKGGNPFTSTVSSLYHAVIHDVTHPWDAAVGWYDSAADALGYFGGWIGTGFGTLGSANTQAHLSANITRGLGHHVSDQQANAAYTGSIGHRLETGAGNAVAIGGTASVAKGLAKGVVQQAFKQTAKDVAEGAISENDLTKIQKVGLAMSAAQKMGFTQRSINDIGNALRAGTLPADDALVQRHLGLISKTLLKTPARIVGSPSELPNLISQSWKDNLPGLARLAPTVQHAAAGLAGGAEEGGWAYRIRNAMAAPYRLAPVRAAGIAAQRAEIGSLAAHGIAGALPGSSLQQDVTKGHAGGLDSWLDNTRWNVLPGVSIGPEDFLLGPLHGDLVGAGRGSRVIGASVDNLLNGLSDTLGKTGVIAAFEHATGLSYADLLKSVGGDSTGLQTWMRNHQYKAASDAFVRRNLGYNPALADAEDEAKVETLRNKWYAMPEDQQAAWLADYTKADPHLQYLRNYLDSSFLSDAVSKQARAAAVKTDLEGYIAGTRIMQDFMRSGAANFVIGPRGAKMLGDVPPWELDGQHIPSINREEPGAYALQKATSKTSSDVLGPGGDLENFRQEFAALPDDPLARMKFSNKLIDYLHTHFNLDAVRLQVLGENPQRLMEVIAERAKHLAADVMPTWDQPQWVKDKLAAIKTAGYKVVVGSHIGHAFDDTLPDLGPIDGHLTALRKYVGKAGLDPGRVPDVEVTRALRNGVMSKIHAVLRDNPNARLTTRHADVRTVMAVLYHGLGNELPSYARGLFNLFSDAGLRLKYQGKALTDVQSLNRTEIETLAKTKYEGDADAMVKARHEVEATMAAQIGLRDVDHSKIIDALTQDQDVALPSGAHFRWNGVNKYTAEQIAAAIKDGYRLPGYMMGWAAMENWARAGFGVGSKLMARDPDKPLYRAVALWPNKVVQVRNALRFTASPVFAARKNAKQDYKMSLELGRPVVVWNPLHELQRNGELARAQKLWTQVSGIKPGTEMEADQYLIGRDVYGIYSPQWKAAWFVNELDKRGDTAQELEDAYHRVFRYGAHGGMTAAERTANTIFFPFSFEKTLLRNTGAYLLDKPGLNLALDLGVEAWRQFDKNGTIGQWVQDHLPILNELQLLNGFAHGISPGQFGGINAPLLNMFLPQMWGSNYTKKNLTRFIPLWNEFGNLVKDASSQQQIAGAAVHDTINSVLNEGWKPEPAMSERAQQSTALRTRATWWSNTGLMSIVDYNNRQSDDADKYLWPTNTKLPVEIWGKPVNKTTLTDYLHYLYPAYDPNQGAAYAKDQAAKISLFIHQISQTDPAKAQQMDAFRHVADAVVTHLNRDDYDQATAGMAQEQFRKAITNLNDPQWKALYNGFYAWALGQIQTPAQKAGAKNG